MIQEMIDKWENRHSLIMSKYTSLLDISGSLELATTFRSEMFIIRQIIDDLKTLQSEMISK